MICNARNSMGCLRSLPWYRMQLLEFARLPPTPTPGHYPTTSAPIEDVTPAHFLRFYSASTALLLLLAPLLHITIFVNSQASAGESSAASFGHAVAHFTRRRTVIAVVVAVTSRGTTNASLETCPLFRYLLPSMLATLDAGFEYWVTPVCVR